MLINFTKMHGCGNDYIYFNCTETEIDRPEALAVRLSDRHFSIGGDGIVMILPSYSGDAKMRMFNADGSEGAMCGNAVRCVAKYLYDNGIVKKTKISIETLSGIKELHLTTDGSYVTSVRVNMGAARAEKITLGGEDAVFVDIGNPHCVLFRGELDGIDAAHENYERHEKFPGGVNTEFVRVTGKNSLTMRVWERGSGETLACGTGACAAAVAAVLRGYCDGSGDIRVTLTGGELIINCSSNEVFMTGGCEKAFDGTVEI